MTKERWHRRNLVRLCLALALLCSTNCRDAKHEVLEEGSAIYLDHAVRVGNWLLEQAELRGDRPIADRVGDETSTAALASGSSGRALFLAELFRITGSISFRERARSEIRSALEDTEESARLGLYNGLAGIAVASNEVGRLTDTEEFRASAVRLFERLLDLETLGGVNDVLAGRAGIGLSLLYAFEETGDSRFSEAASMLGDELLALSLPTANDGLRWMRGEEHAMDLPNFSHGTAGVGLFMARLAATTKQDRFQDAALRASAYLDHIANRDDDLFLVPYGVPNEGFASPHDIGWAHGPAGTGRLHYALWRLTDSEEMWARVDASAKTLMATGLPGDSSDPELWVGPFATDRRFGTAGVAAFLSDWARVSGRTELFTKATEIVGDIVSRGIRTEQGLYWATPLYGFQEGEGDASFTGYFYGAAGYGTLLLQHHRAVNDTFPAVRLPDDPFPRFQ